MLRTTRIRLRKFISFFFAINLLTADMSFSQEEEAKRESLGMARKKWQIVKKLVLSKKVSESPSSDEQDKQGEQEEKKDIKKDQEKDEKKKLTPLDYALRKAQSKKGEENTDPEAAKDLSLSEKHHLEYGLNIWQTDNEKAMKMLTSTQVSCDGCLDKEINNIVNLFQDVADSTGNRDELEQVVLKKVLVKTLNTDLAKMVQEAQDISAKGGEIPKELSQKILAILKVHKKLVLDQLHSQIESLRGKGDFSEEQKKELAGLVKRSLRPLGEDPFRVFWQSSLAQAKNPELARKVREMTLFAEYLAKWAQAPQKKYTPVRIRLATATLSSTKHDMAAITKFINGAPDARSERFRVGVLGNFDQQFMLNKRTLSAQREKEEQLAEKKEREADRIERIENGEILSKQVLKRAKHYYNLYLKTYKETERACMMALYNPAGCKRAQEYFIRVGRNYYMKKMWELIALYNRDKSDEERARERLWRSYWLNHHHGMLAVDTTDKRGLAEMPQAMGPQSDGRYSLFDSSRDYGAYADGFARAPGTTETSYPIQSFDTGRSPFGRSQAPLMRGGDLAQRPVYSRGFAFENSLRPSY